MLDQAIRSSNLYQIEAIILFLEDYVVTHFQEEEDLMKAHHYKGYKDHKQDHEVFKARVAQLRETYDQGISKAHLIFGIRIFIDQLVDHIKTVDVGIASIAGHH